MTIFRVNTSKEKDNHHQVQHKKKKEMTIIKYNKEEKRNEHD
jgi:hypothetical protein